MIRSFEVKLNAAHPELPLFEASAIVGSPSTAFIRRVPATVGTWTITKVYAQAEYPDGTITTVEAAKGAEGVWTATLPATQTSGRVRCGFTVLADGIDENDEPVTGYTLGIADMAVYTRDLVVQPGTTAVIMKYFDSAPTPAKKGDVAPIDDAIKFFNGTEWVAFGSDVDLSDYYTKQETDEAIDRLAAYYITYTAAGAAFPTRAALLSAETYYSGGVARVPTRNDYAVVLADESHSGAEYRYIYAVADGQTTGQWEAQYPIETNDYTALSRKPSINGVTLTGNKKSTEIGVASRADAKLYPVASGTPAFTEWTITADGLPVGTTVSQPDFNTYGADGGAWTVTIQNQQEGIQTALSVAGDEYTANDTYLVFRGAVSYYSARIVATRTCTNLIGYCLGRDVGVTAGMNNDKQLQPAGDYATQSDATLTVVYGGNGQKYSDWTCDPATIEDMGETHEFHVEKMSTGWRIMLDNAFFSPEFGNDDTTDYTYTGTSPIGEITVVATRVANTVSYQLGTQADKLLASEAAVEALSGEVTGKVSKTGDTMTGGLTVPNLTVGSRDSQHQVGTGSTAEGENVSAVGMYCHAEGTNTYSSGYASHAEGFRTTATTNTGTHAEGCLTTALGEGSHAEGGNTETKNEYEHAEGRYNNSHRAAAYNWGGAGNTLSATGFGSSENAKRNAKETMQDGKTYIYGIGGYDGTNPNTTGVKDLATAVNDKVDKIVPAAAGNIATLTATGGLADSGVDVATALRYALGETITATATLADRTNNKVIPAANNTSDIKLYFPAATGGKARDFIVTITNTTGNTGKILFKVPSGASVYGDAFKEPIASGETWIYSFTEISVNEFFAKAQKVEDPYKALYWGLYFEAEEDGAEVSMSKTGSPSAVSLETSTDGATWTTFDAEGGTTPITLANVGDRVYFRAGSGGNTVFASDDSNYHAFTLSKKCGAYGNIMSLLADNSSNTTISANGAFRKLFFGCANLTAAPTLAATTITSDCYGSMFKNCTSLEAAPLLPATTLADGCYAYMFEGCTALVDVPPLPAMTMAGSCYYYMFYGCTALTTAPELPATTLAWSCYYAMFYGCRALTKAPDLPATSTAQYCYKQMFYYCSSLETGPDIAITSIGSWSAWADDMFNLCSNLKSVRVAFTTWDGTGTWMDRVQTNSGTFYCPAALGTNETITRGNSNCPNNWTVVNV